MFVAGDRSSDVTKKYLEEINDKRVRPFFQEYEGPKVARNRGLKEATGKYMKFWRNVIMYLELKILKILLGRLERQNRTSQIKN